MVFLVAAIFILIIPCAALICFRRGARLQVAQFSALVGAFYVVIFLLHATAVMLWLATISQHLAWQEPFDSKFFDRWTVFCFVMMSVTAAVALYLLQVAMLAIGPPKAITKRLGFLAIGVIFLAVLNQLSLYAPDIRALLKPPA